MSELRTLHTQITVIGGHTKPIRGLYVGDNFLIVADEAQVYYYKRPYEDEDSYGVECTFKDKFGGAISCMAYSIAYGAELLYLGTTLGCLNVVRLKTTNGRKTMCLDHFFYVGRAAVRKLQWLTMAKILVITAASPNIYMYVPLLGQVFSRRVSNKPLTHSFLDELTEALYVSDSRDYVRVFNIPLSNPGIINQNAAVRGSSLFVSLYDGASYTPTTSIIASGVGSTRARNLDNKFHEQSSNKQGTDELSTIKVKHNINFNISVLPKAITPSTVYSLKSKKHYGKKVLTKLSNFFKQFSNHTNQVRYVEPSEFGVCALQTEVPGENVIDASTRAVSIVTNCTGQDAVYIPKPVAALGMNSARRLVQSAHKKSVRIFLIDPVNGLIFTGGDDKVIAIWNIESLFVSGESYIIDTSNFNYKKVTALAFSPLRLVLFSADESGAINVFDANNLLIVNTWLAHSGPINGIFLNDEAGLLYTYGNDGLIKVWRVWIDESECLAARKK
ncbi:Hypothetical protein GLP15_2858 [Giardia lamblia P15]|uniref:Uncharacterized protein n=1 Tax=Giardia intestinalis (strain P15) TaxID=658858 RepID=E1F1W4_GIAIA|nr:Hypothetical protein GLP15_2858 [Giardia lamblia P15]